MTLRQWISRLSITLGVWFIALAGAAQADEWGRYYHWPYHAVRQYQWSPYEYEKTYNGYRYPREMRVYHPRHGYRDWATSRKPFYRGHHFILDRF